MAGELGCHELLLSTSEYPGLSESQPSPFRARTSICTRQGLNPRRRALVCCAERRRDRVGCRGVSVCVGGRQRPEKRGKKMRWKQKKKKGGGSSSM